MVFWLLELDMSHLYQIEKNGAFVLNYSHDHMEFDFQKTKIITIKWLSPAITDWHKTQELLAKPLIVTSHK